jgi:hypothetical protein
VKARKKVRVRSGTVIEARSEGRRWYSRGTGLVPTYSKFQAGTS